MIFFANLLKYPVKKLLFFGDSQFLIEVSLLAWSAHLSGVPVFFFWVLKPEAYLVAVRMIELRLETSMVDKILC